MIAPGTQGMVAGTRFYVSGGMTGWPNNNQDAFDAVEWHLTNAGHKVTTPVELGRLAGEQLEGDGYNADDEEYEGFLERDLALISRENFDAIIFVRGWQRSGGAGREGRKAIQEGLQLYVWDEAWRIPLRISADAFLTNSTVERRRPEEPGQPEEATRHGGR